MIKNLGKIEGPFVATKGPLATVKQCFAAAKGFASAKLLFIAWKIVVFVMFHFSVALRTRLLD